ncbi:MAG TPA: aspartate-semialdehyde dehydrogenase [Myxococcota bacterium]|nr:aspartate-semialdehyde dehydrogenase [Myxococcota bacterium]HQK49806.1 aspartate-semialdehyde dehydrogenase [Myxococcota bacterium]
MTRTANVAVVGATGAVGQEAVHLLEERGFPVGRLVLLASGRSAGAEMAFQGRLHRVEVLSQADFRDIDLVLSAPGASVSREFAPRAVAAGAVVIDKSSAFRMDPEVPLVVPEVNGEAALSHRGIVSSPNCSTIPLVVCLKPLHEAFGVRRVVVSTYQAVSGAGRRGGEELFRQTVALLNHRPLETEAFPHQIAFNVLPQVETFRPEDEGYTTEEVKIVQESRRILGIPDLRLTATAVRVPVMNGHSESVNVELDRPVSAEEAREVLSRAPGVAVVDDPAGGEYPMPLEATGRDEVLVGRIRRDPTVASGLNLWLACDNLRKGAALNAVQIAEFLWSRAEGRRRLVAE